MIQAFERLLSRMRDENLEGGSVECCSETVKDERIIVDEQNTCGIFHSHLHWAPISPHVCVQSHEMEPWGRRHHLDCVSLYLHTAQAAVNSSMS
ncbi:MAG: hypothetical protein ACE366_01905 [Bradymonadia bacterium]